MNLVDLRQSEKYGQYMGKIGWQVEKINNCQVFIKKLPLVGSIIKIQRPAKIPFREIDSLAKKHHALFVKLEPQQFENETMKQLNHYGYKPSSPLSPSKTLQIDLTQSKEKIFSQFKKDCRYEIRKAKKNEIVVRQSNDIDSFIKMWHKNAWSRGFWIPIKKEIRALYEAFGNDTCLTMASYSNDINHPTSSLAGALLIIYDGVAYYFHATSSSKGRQLSVLYLVVWEAIKLAKKRGCQIFDFEGIYDERFPNKSWLGFSHFKKSFGGKEIEYPGAFIKFYNPVLDFISKFRRLV